MLNFRGAEHRERLSKIILSSGALVRLRHRAFNFLSCRQNDANSERPQVKHHIMFGHILLLQTILILTKAGPRMLSVYFVTKASVDEALPEQQSTPYGVLYLANLKQAYPDIL